MDFWYICLSWPAALEHGRIEENSLNRGISRVWGDKGIGNIVKHDVLERFYGDKCVNYRALNGGNHCKSVRTHSKNTGIVDL